MAERFRIDLGFPALYASLSMDTKGITDGVVVYDKERQQLFYTGSYGSGGGGGGSIDTGSFLINATATLNTITFTQGDGSTFNVTINTGSGGVAGVTSLEGLTGAIDLIAGSGIQITNNESNAITITNTQEGYWELINNNIVNSGSLDVIITSSLTIDQYNNEDIFLVKRNNVPKVKVNNQGVLTLMPTGSFPTAVTGGMIYKDNEFYFGYL